MIAERQREDLIEAREFFLKWVKEVVPESAEERELLYNRLIKAYLKGYNNALINIQDFINNEE